MLALKAKMFYYRILCDDEQFADRWFLEEPVTASGDAIDGREFTYGCPYVGPLPKDVPIYQEGRRVQFHLAAFDMPVVTAEIADIVEAIAPGETEHFPVTVASSILGYVILNAIHSEACVDEVRSRYTLWTPEDGPSRPGRRYRELSKLVVDPARTHNRHVFRVEHHEVSLIVSGAIKQALDGIENLGIIFAPVF